MQAEPTLMHISSNEERGEWRFWEAVFDVKLGERRLKMFAWLHKDTDEGEVVEKAQAQMRQHLQSLMEFSKEWSQP